MEVLFSVNGLYYILDTATKTYRPIPVASSDYENKILDKIFNFEITKTSLTSQ